MPLHIEHALSAANIPTAVTSVTLGDSTETRITGKRDPFKHSPPLVF